MSATGTLSEPRTMEWYRTRSLWLDGALSGVTKRPPLAGGMSADVAIVGGGLIGIWAAYTLAIESPELSVVVVERDIVGYGAAGRNGGWAGAGLPGSPALYARERGWEATRRAAELMREAIDDMGGVIEAEAIACGFQKGGSLSLATTQPQRQRLQHEHDSLLQRGLAGEGDTMLSAAESQRIVHAAGVVAGAFSPHCARVDPALLVRGLAEAAERRGVRIFEGTEAIDVRPGIVRTAAGDVDAAHVVLATEAWTSQLRGHRLSHLPLTSMMIATEPLPAEVWDELGWPPGLTVRDKSHLFFYAQRTRDDRIAIGGRGSPYDLRRPHAEFSDRDIPVWARLKRTVEEVFPAAAGATITHRWGGLLGVPRDWSMGIVSDERSGMISASGLSGHGVVAANIAGRTVARLIRGERDELTAMPWVGHRSRRWEPEPARYVAASAIVGVLSSADNSEGRTGRTAKRTQLVKPFQPPV